MTAAIEFAGGALLVVCHVFNQFVVKTGHCPLKQYLQIDSGSDPNIRPVGLARCLSTTNSQQGL